MLPTLVEQVTLECRQILQPGAFDIIEITGEMEQQRVYMKEAASQSEVPDHMKIYIVTTAVSVN